MSELQAKKAKRAAELARQRAKLIDERLPSTQIQKKREDRLAELQGMSDLFKAVFYNDRGRSVLDILKSKWNYNQSIFVGDPQTLAYNAGKQDAINEIMEILEERYKA